MLALLAKTEKRGLGVYALGFLGYLFVPNIDKIGSSKKFVGNFLGSLALYSSVYTEMTKVVLSVIFV
uniref:Uncharacterized protein n=1 Tax=Candidatus Kentrum sp. UNK TaxID=2126344 RepID=A0A451AV29_9GAMM|nr:MAG: hypothetical protein BECKUNK1418G_GA0071005_10125 [Candidatus Kentron sp. UNK]VFK69888.1 MAG: hypothetical protein BECKUNK1418H_GA0071006_102037 [Candidatus Kentron sp. UNK]